MTEYHVNENGTPGVCRAKKKCPYGDLFNEHYGSKKDAQEAYEDKQNKLAILNAPVSKDFKQHAITKQAINSSLTYNGPIPKWFKKELKNRTEQHLGKAPEIIDEIEIGGKKVAVVWSEYSTHDNDTGVQYENGFKVSTIDYQDMKTGEKLGYLKARYSSEETYDKVYGTDRFADYRFLASQDFSLALSYSEEKDHKLNGGFYSEYLINADTAETEEGKLQGYKEIWANTHKHFRVSPLSDKEQASYQLTVDKAPATIEEIEEDLKQIDDLIAEQKTDFINSWNNALVDYSRIEQKHRGEGLGASLYVYSARKLAEDNRALRSSGVQSPEADKFWKRIANDKEIPVGVKSRRFQLGDIRQNKNSFVIDYTDSYEKPEMVESFKSLSKAS